MSGPERADGADAPDAGPGLWAPRRLAVQAIGFVVGLVLLGWCVKMALEGGDWNALRQASPWLVAGLLACSVASLLVNATLFWVTIRPVQRLRLGDLVMLNLGCNLLNYAPIRLGAIARVLHHMRLDGMSVLGIGAWFGMIVYVLALVVGTCVAATIARPRIDLVWAALVLSMLLLLAGLTRVVASHRLVARHGQGVDRMLLAPSSLGGAMALRLVDLAAFSARMYCAMRILELALDPHEIVVLAIVAFAATLIPAGGQFGFRELAVTLMAVRLTGAGVDEATLQELATDSGDFAQLALVESAGDALVRIPLGIVGVVWMRRAWARRTRAGGDATTPG